MRVLRNALMMAVFGVGSIDIAAFGQSGITLQISPNSLPTVSVGPTTTTRYYAPSGVYYQPSTGFYPMTTYYPSNSYPLSSYTPYSTYRSTYAYPTYTYPAYSYPRRYQSGTTYFYGPSYRSYRGRW